MSEFLCKCGHRKFYHIYMDDILASWPHIMVCGECDPVLDHPHEFKLDNLKYLEDLYNEKSFV